MSDADIGKRKGDHIDLATSGDIGFRRATTLLECVHLVHDALPELALNDVDTSLNLLGKPLRAPIVIAGMTGGIDRAGVINRELAAVAERRGYGFGLGSQRAMQLDPDCAETYRVREVAPTALVLGNIGAVHAGTLATEAVAALVAEVGADALCVHLNPAMELVQPEGDRDFTGCAATLRRLVTELPVPVIAKETGCGISGAAGRRLRAAGIRHVDISGAGGTSWVAAEMHRAEGAGRALGVAFREWGIPTAASVAMVAPLGFETVIATGGVATGLDIARALALGASAAGLARPVLQALVSGGREAVDQVFDRIETELRVAMLLVGARDLAGLRRCGRIIRGELRDWIGGGDGKVAAAGTG